MNTTYTASLMDCKGISDTDRRTAETLFCTALEYNLNGAENVVPAYKAYAAAFEAHGELPLPAAATDAERAAVSRWEAAEAAGCLHAFAGWVGDVGGAHFEIGC